MLSPRLLRRDHRVAPSQVGLIALARAGLAVFIGYAMFSFEFCCRWWACGFQSKSSGSRVKEIAIILQMGPQMRHSGWTSVARPVLVKQSCSRHTLLNRHYANIIVQSVALYDKTCRTGAPERGRGASFEAPSVDNAACSVHSASPLFLTCYVRASPWLSGGSVVYSSVKA